MPLRRLGLKLRLRRPNRLLARTLFLLLPLNAASGQVVSPNNPLAQLSGSIRQLTSRVSRAVVEVLVTGFATADEGKGRSVSQISRQHSTGSGVVVDPAGYVMTNAHVVQGAISVKVLVASGSHGADGRPLPPIDTVDARILGIDRESDLALLKVDVPSLTALRFGDSDSLHQGDLVLAIGSPLGLRNSVSMGVISDPARAVNDENPILYIQTDASINPGDSGGALVDTAGRLVGMNTFIVTQSGGNEGIGFAIPSAVVQNAYKQLRQKGRVARGSIGLFVQDITAPMAKGLSLSVRRGIVVADVEPKGPADLAGLQRRDVILGLNGKAIDRAREFDDAVYRRPAGDKVTLLVQRGGDRLTASVKVTTSSTPWDPLVELVSPEKNLVPRLGILCIEIDKEVAAMMPDLRRQYGLIVAAQSHEGQAQFIDLRPGDIIHAVNNLPVASLASFREAIDQFERGDSVVLQIERDSRFQYMAFEIE